MTRAQNDLDTTSPLTALGLPTTDRRSARQTHSDDRPKALSTVLAGGVAAGVLGPQLVSATMDLSPHTYALTYIAAAGIAALTGWILWAFALARR